MKKPSINSPVASLGRTIVALSGRAVPLEFNLPMNRYPFSISCHSDSTRIRVCFYEFRGLYWFGFRIHGVNVNSLPFLSARNCTSGLHASLKSLGFRFDDSDSADSIVKGWRASFVPSPKSRRV